MSDQSIKLRFASEVSLSGRGGATPLTRSAAYATEAFKVDRPRATSASPSRCSTGWSKCSQIQDFTRISGDRNFLKRPNFKLDLEVRTVCQSCWGTQLTTRIGGESTQTTSKTSFLCSGLSNQCCLRFRWKISCKPLTAHQRTSAKTV